MLFLSAYEIEDAQRRYIAWHPVLSDATRTLAELAEWTNSHSDGWAYWPKPCRAAAKLQELIGTLRTYYDDPERNDATREKLVAAYKPIRAFRTRQSADFPIYLDGKAT